MYCLLTNLRLAASSIAHGIFVAASTKTLDASPSAFSLSVCLLPAAARCKSDHWIKNSVLMRLVDSCSLEPPREDKSESISSTKIIEGASALAREKSARTNFSDSPNHFEVRLLAEMAKNVDLDSVATALASIVFPVPGGPKSNIPLAGSRRPKKRSGRRKG